MALSTFASLRNKYLTSNITVTVGSGGLTTSAYSLGLRVFGVSRAGKNINSDRIAVSVSAGQQVTITLNSALRAGGEDIYRIGIAGETTGNDADSYILAEFEAKQSNQLTDIIFSPIVFFRDQHFVINGAVANYASLPSNPINGTARFVTGENKSYLYRLGTWVEVNGLSAYTLTTTEKRTAGKLYGGCDVPIISLDTGEFIPIPEYDATIGGNSYPLKLWLLNGTEEIGGAVIAKGNFIDLELLLNGSSSGAAIMSGRVTATALGKVRKLTGVSINTDITSTSAIWEYNNSNLFIVPEDINAGYALAFSVVFNLAELSDGDNLSFRIFDKGLFAIPELALGVIFGDGIFPVAPYCRIVPSLSGIRRLPGQGLIKDNRFQTQSSYDTSLGVVVDTANQKVAISGVLVGQVRVRQSGESLIGTEAVRAIISTESGVAPASNWSSPVTLAAGQQISVVVSYPCNNSGIGTIRSDYPDVIAANSGADFTPVRLRVEVRRSGTIYQQSSVTIVPNTTQTFIISSLGTAGSSPSTNNSPSFNLWGYSGISVSAIAGTSSLTAANYEVRIYYEYPSPNPVVTKISHLTADGCIPELLATYSEIVNSYAYGGLISSGDTTRGYLGNKFTAGSGIALEKLSVGGNERLRIDVSNLPTSKISSGIFPIARLASGIPTGAKFIRDDGVLAVPSGSGGGHIIMDFGIALPQRSKLNFSGGLLIATDDPQGDITKVELLPDDILAGFPPQPSNFFLASQTGGGAVYPAFRAIVSADIPNLAASKITSGVFSISRLATGTPTGSKFIRDDGVLAVPPSGRVALTANTTYYIRTDGSDSNTGLADNSGGAFLTIQKAINEWAKLDNAGYLTTVLIRAGTYTISTPIVCKDGVGGGLLVIQGASNTTTIIDLNTVPTNAHCCCIVADGVSSAIQWEHLRLTVSATGSRSGQYYNCLIYATNAAKILLKEINFGNVATSSSFGGSIMAEANSLVTLKSSTFAITGSYSGSSPSTTCFNLVRLDAIVNYEFPHIFTSGVSLTYTHFMNISAGKIQCWADVTNGTNFSAVNSVTATKHLVSANGVLNTFGTLSNIPGNFGGSVATGGQAI